MNLIARVIAYSSALNMLALLGSLIVLEKSPAMTAEATSQHLGVHSKTEG